MRGALTLTDMQGTPAVRTESPHHARRDDPLGPSPSEDEREPSRGLAWLMFAMRYLLPATAAVAGVIVMLLGSESDVEGGAGIVSAGLAIYVTNWLYRASVEGDRVREQEEAARVYLQTHGHWPDEAGVPVASDGHNPNEAAVPIVSHGHGPDEADVPVASEGHSPDETPAATVPQANCASLTRTAFASASPSTAREQTSSSCEDTPAATGRLSSSLPRKRR